MRFTLYSICLRLLSFLLAMTVFFSCMARSTSASQIADFGRYNLCDNGKIPLMEDNNLMANSYKNSVAILNLKNLATDCPNMTFDPKSPNSEATKCIMRHGGTGFLLSQDGFVATNYHVARHCGNFDEKFGYTGMPVKCLRDHQGGLQQNNILLAAVRVTEFECSADGKTKPYLSNLIPLSLVSIPPVDAANGPLPSSFAYSNGDDIAILKMEDQQVGIDSLRCLRVEKPVVGSQIYFTGFPGSDGYSLQTLTSKHATASGMIAKYNGLITSIKQNPTNSINQFQGYIASNPDKFSNSDALKTLLSELSVSDPDWLVETILADLQLKIQYYSTAIDTYNFMSQQINATMPNPENYVSSDRTMRTTFGRVTRLTSEVDAITSDKNSLGDALLTAQSQVAGLVTSIKLNPVQRDALKNLVMQIIGIDDRINWATNLSTLLAAAILDEKVQLLRQGILATRLKESSQSYLAVKDQLNSAHEDGSIIFLSNADNAGGFSGSSVFNAAGEIVGLNRLKILSKDLPLFERLLAMDGFYKSFNQSLSGHIFSRRLISYIDSANTRLSTDHFASKINYTQCR